MYIFKCLNYNRSLNEKAKQVGKLFTALMFKLTIDPVMYGINLQFAATNEGITA